MYKNNSRNSSKFNGCSPLQLSCILTGKCHAIGYYSYTKRSCEIVSLRSTLSHERATASHCSVKLFRFATQLHRTTAKDNIILQTLRDLKNSTAFGRSPFSTPFRKCILIRKQRQNLYNTNNF